MTKKQPDIKYLFEPRAIAVIGASPHKEKIGYQILDNIINGGYKGKVYPINPKGGEILGLKAYADIKDVPKDVDLAIVVVPAKFVFDSIQNCPLKNVKYLSIITSGFSEVGNIDGERKLVAFAQKNGMRVLGPNIFGTYTSSCSLNASFGPSDVMKGGVAIITQSGALGIAMIGKTKVENVGLSSIVSLGNKSDIDEADLLEYLADDDNTKVILMYIEGVKSGEKFVRVLKQTTKKKPVVVIKSGRSKRGAMAAASHTGSLAGADEVFTDVMKQCGANRAETINEALSWCKYLSETPLPKGENVVIITNGGGVGVLAADSCEKYDVNLYDDQEALEKAFIKSIPSYGSYKNPVDITGGAGLDGYKSALKAAAKDDNINSIICLGCETAVLETDKLSSLLEKVYKKNGSKKPYIFSFVGGDKIEKCISYLKNENVPIFSDVDESVSCLGALYANYRTLKDAKERSELREEIISDISLDKIENIIESVLEQNRNFLLADEAKKFMEIVGIRLPQSKIAKNIGEAVKFADEIGYPVVMKVVSKDIIHKSDAGGVALNLEHKEDVINAFEAIMQNCKAYKSNAMIKGIEVCEMVKSGVETIVGGRMDPSFGPVIMFGLGGVYVEVMKDVSFRALPIDQKEALSMIKETKAYPLLLGVRGEDAKDIANVVTVLLRLGFVLKHCSRISDIEINPLIAYDEGEGVMAVDARILLSKN